MTERRKTPTLHIASDFYHDLIKTETEAGPVCLCIQGNEAAVTQEIAAWRAPRHTFDLHRSKQEEGQLCNDIQLYHRDLEHRISAVFLDDYYSHSKNQQRNTYVSYGRKDEKRKKPLRYSEDLYHFKHSDSIEGHIKSYRKSRHEQLIDIHVKDAPVDVFDDLFMDSVVVEAKDPLLR